MIVFSRAGVSMELARFRSEDLIEPQGKDRIVLVGGLVRMKAQPVFARSSSLCDSAMRKARALRTALYQPSAFRFFVRLFDAVQGKTGAPPFVAGRFFVRRALRPIRLAAGGAAPARGVGVDGHEVADLGDAFDASSYLLHRALLVVGVDLAPDLGYLDVEAGHVGGARVLADPRPDALLEFLLESRVAPLPR
jgi:hypothetical protein